MNPRDIERRRDYARRVLVAAMTPEERATYEKAHADDAAKAKRVAEVKAGALVGKAHEANEAPVEEARRLARESDRPGPGLAVSVEHRSHHKKDK